MVTRKDYYRRLDLGLCPQCGHSRDRNFLTCSKCNKTVKNWIKKNYSSSQKVKVNKKYRKQRIKDKECPNCGQSLPNLDFRKCPECRLKDRLYYKKNALKIKLRRVQLQNEKTTKRNT